MRSKKLLICLLCLTLIISASACGAAGSSEKAAAQTQSAASGDAVSPAPTPAPAAESESKPVVVDQPAAEPVGTTPAEPADTASAGEKNALNSAKQYLRVMAFSYSGLVDQLKFEGYTDTEAAYAADHCDADWNEQALLSAQTYLKTMSFSKDGLVEQLEFEGFTHEQAVYGAENAYGSTADVSGTGDTASAGEQNALRSAEQYLGLMAFSYSGLIQQLTFEGYTDSEAAYAADHCGADWNEQAAKAAKQYLDMMAFSRDGLIEQLEFEGYTHEQAVYGASQNGY